MPTGHIAMPRVPPDPPMVGTVLRSPFHDHSSAYKRVSRPLLSEIAFTTPNAM